MTMYRIARARYKRKYRATQRTWLMLAVFGACVVLAVMMIVSAVAKTPAKAEAEAATPAVSAQSMAHEAQAAPSQQAALPQTALAGKMVIVDAGHGGFDQGTTGVDNAIEKEVNLAIAQKLQKKLTALGATVVMTREDDGALGESKEEDFLFREALIEKSGADLFVSIHQNSFPDESENGAQVFYLERGNKGKELAEFLQTELNGMEENKRHRSAQSSDYRILKKGDHPSCTVECGFLTNPDDEALLVNDDYQEKLAERIAAGMEAYAKQYLTQS